MITDPCIGTKDRSCVDVCPVDCIHDDGDDDKILYIDPDECIDCGACEPACPVNAIFAEDDVPGRPEGVHRDQRALVQGQGRGAGEGRGCRRIAIFGSRTNKREASTEASLRRCLFRKKL